MSTVAASTEEIKISTKYTYDYTRLPPVAMAGALPDAEAFSARPDWIHLVARSALKILINTIMIGVRNKGDNIEFVQQVLKNIQGVAQQLGGEAERDLNNAIAIELEKQGSPTTLPRLNALLEVVIEPLAPKLNLKTRGLVDLLLASSIDQSRVFAVKAAQSYQRNLNTSMLPQTLAQRGVDDASRLPDYPYRDDALLVWGAINQWVENYVNHYYTSDAAVQADTELQNWVAELVAHDGGRLNNIGAANRISKRTELVDSITLICFTASAQHAAVNFPQGPLMSYLPATPPAGYSPLSSLRQEGFSENDFLKFLPPLDIAKALVDILYLLSSVYYTKLGDYGDGYFTDPVIQAHLATFQQELLKIEAEINERNKTRTPYEFLLPSKIPQSINI